MENIVRSGTKLRAIDFGVGARGQALSPPAQFIATESLGKYITSLESQFASQAQKPFIASGPPPGVAALLSKGGTSSTGKAEMLISKPLNKTVKLSNQEITQNKKLVKQPIANIVSVPHQVKRRQQWLNKHREAQIKSSINSHNPGRKHRRSGNSTLIL